MAVTRQPLQPPPGILAGRPAAGRMTLLVALIALLGAAHMLIRTANYGAAVNPDSVTYLSAAISLLNGDGLQHSRGCAMVGQPPFYSLLIASVAAWGVEPLDAGRFINIAAFALILLVAGLWMRRHVRSPAIALGAILAAAAWPPLSHEAAFIRTEPVFVLCALLALLQLSAFLNRQGDWAPLALAALFAGIAALTRYPGATLIVVGAALPLLRRDAPLASRLARSFAFGAAASLPLAAALVRNLIVSGALVRLRDRPWSSTLAESPMQLIGVLQEWMLPIDAPAWAGALLWGLLLAALLAAAAIALLARRAASARGEAQGKSGGGTALALVLPFVAFAFLYVLFMAVATPLTVSQPIDSRYLLPIYLPMLLAGAVLLDRFLSLDVEGKLALARQALAVCIALAVLANICLCARRNFAQTVRAWQTGHYAYTYNTAHWKDSELLEYLRAGRIEGMAFSNNPYILWFADPAMPAGKYRTLHFNLPKLIQRIEGTSAATRQSEAIGRCLVPGTLPNLRQRFQSGEDAMTIVWFKRFERREYSYDDRDLRTLPGLELIADLQDGAVFRATSGGRIAPSRAP